MHTLWADPMPQSFKAPSACMLGRDNMRLGSNYYICASARQICLGSNNPRLELSLEQISISAAHLDWSDQFDSVLDFQRAITNKQAGQGNWG